MTGSKTNGGSPRPKLASQPPGAPSPAVSTTIHAAGESVHSLPEAAMRRSENPPASSTGSPSTRRSPSSEDSSKRRSWFLRKGTWPRPGQKTSAIAEVAPENVSSESLNHMAGEHIGSETSQSTTKPFDKKLTRATDSAYSQLNVSTQSLPVFRGAKAPSPAPSTPAPPVETVSAPDLEQISKPPQETNSQETAKTIVPANDTEETTSTSREAVQPAGSTTPSSWLGWYGGWYGQSRPATAEAATAKLPGDPKKPTVEVMELPKDTVLDAQEGAISERPQGPTPADCVIKDTFIDSSDDAKDEVQRARARSSWLNLWGYGYGGYTAAPTADLEQTTEGPSPPSIPEALAPTSPPPPIEIRQAPESSQSPSEATVSQPTLSGIYGWAFWSRSKGPDTVMDSDVGVKEVAIVDGSSENVAQNVKIQPPPPIKLKESTVAPILKDGAQPPSPKPDQKKVEPPKESPAPPPTGSPVPSAKGETSPAKQKLQKILPQNHVFPAFEQCYRYPENPSYLQQLTKFLRRQGSRPMKNLFLERNPPPVKKAVAIGVHGFFPMRLVRTVLGEPTGTSIRFANHAASSIKRWAEKNDIEVEVEKIALEGEGKVGDRVEMLWKLLQNWMGHVRDADFVMMAAHSQGVVVGVQLLARLIEEGCVEKASRIGFTAMAGINLGPFGHLPTTLLTGSARELFEFQKTSSAVSQKYIQALRTILAQHVRILYVGSIDDQLVPLESSTITNIHHPYIYRAVFVDGRVHAPDFLSHLVGFAMKLRNLGISDHGLIRELSAPLAGSLYGGEGHSRIYDDGAVYDLGVRHALETTQCENVPLKVDPFELPSNSNPYFLPWSMRGLLEEPHVRTELAKECLELLELFENWKPTTKPLKDVKFRLEGIRSKL